AHTDDGYMDVDEAAAFLACTPGRLYALKSANRIPHRKDGSRLLFRRDELHAWIEAGGGCRP
nr:helix-turn-helix domain-containing protein [Thermoleophilaceae bacterium]